MEPTMDEIVKEARRFMEQAEDNQLEYIQREMSVLIRYVEALDNCIKILPPKPPEQWEIELESGRTAACDELLKRAKAKMRVIMNRLAMLEQTPDPGGKNPKALKPGGVRYMGYQPDLEANLYAIRPGDGTPPKKLEHWLEMALLCKREE